MDFVQPSKWKTLSENATARLTSAEKQASLHLKDVEKVKRLISETLSCSSHLNSIDNVRERLEYIVARTALLNIGVYELSERDGDVSAMLWAVLGLAIQVCTFFILIEP